MLRNLEAEQEQLQGTAQTWARRGAALEAAVGQACAPRELERFNRFMADLERVLGLLLLLGSRLARVRRALARTGAHGDPEEQVKGFRLQESRAAKRTCPSRSRCPLPAAPGLSVAATRAPAAAAGGRQGAEGACGAARAGPPGSVGAGTARQGAARLLCPPGRQGRCLGPAAQLGRAGPAPSGPTGCRQERPRPSTPISQAGLFPRDPSSG